MENEQEVKPKRDLKAQAALARSFIKPGRPFASSNMGSKQPSALAKAFKAAGLDWKTEFARAIMSKDFKMMKFWQGMMSYLTTQNPGFRKNGGKVYGDRFKVTPGAMEALEKLEGRSDA